MSSRIESVYVGLSMYSGEEGPVTIHLPSVTGLPPFQGPLFGSRIEDLRVLASIAAKAEGRRILVARFSAREDVEVVG